MKELQSLSACYDRIDLCGDDQILLLITCDGSARQRLVIAARRLREGESRESLRRFLP